MLSSSSATEQERLEALKYFGHSVGYRDGLVEAGIRLGALLNEALGELANLVGALGLEPRTR